LCLALLKTYVRKRIMNQRQKHFSASLIALGALLSVAPIQGAWAQTAPNLGTASNFAVLGGAGVTCTDSSIMGAVGSLLAVTPTATCSITGATHVGDAAAIAANNDFLAAYTALATNNPCPSLDATHNLVGDLGGRTISPGLYCISGTGLLTSKLTLNGPSNGIWIFRAATDLTPVGGSVVMAGGGQACNVYWQTGTALSLDATQFLGNILAGSAVTFTSVGSSLVGRALAKTAVTMTGTSVIGCDVLPGPGGQPPATCKDHDRHHHGHDKDMHDGHDKDKHDGHDDDSGHGSDARWFGSNDKDGGKKH
jgi:Ice-binding-like